MKLRITVQGQTYDVEVQVLEGDATPAAPAATASFGEAPAGPAATAPASAGAARDVTAPIAGAVAAIPVAVGDAVERGQTLVVLEAMKMESNIDAPAAGRVEAIQVKVSDNVTQGQTLVRLA